MAIQPMYSLFDKKALTYSPPFVASNDQVAIRMVRDLVQDTNTTVGRHASDYTLYGIATWDDALGLVIAQTPLQLIVEVIALVPAPMAQAPLPFDAYKRVEQEFFKNGEA